MPTLEMLELLSRIGAAGTWVFIIIALLRGWFILPREVKTREDRITELVDERDRWQAVAFDSLQISDKVANAVAPRLRSERR